MHGFVEAHNRRGELAEALGFRLGGGRGKILFQLRDGPLTLGQLAEANGVERPLRNPDRRQAGSSRPGRTPPAPR